ncbi:uncharacterized protein LOC119073993 [Bradysia coprophila]|uniref:uncharacterized protein LOC119073993 n=1 Tax=Bradysia coprophila TaxID=38358 RepID=UPI00187D8F54|nr:uncharacterized protein LOC119073993 [Bradysia coprophila]
MSSNKRQKVEEYHDPDYCQDASKASTPAETNSERQDKIKMIIKREFLKEISSKEEEINLIDHKLNQTKRLLQRVRYAVTMSYYTKKNLVHSANELKCESNATETISATVGQAIHPSLKKLLGKKPIDYEEILKGRSPRNAAKTARSTLIKSKKKGTGKPDKDVAINEMKVPRYISPTKSDVHIEKINSSRGRNQTSHLIVVGNTSKYIGDEKSANEVTHKWLVYIKTKTPVGIEDMVSKVRFFLHPSYKPNDVIEVDSPPFQISRRGWGEFPIRVQLYFHEIINQKPLQIIHNLILDKKMTGLQTMGAETVVEVWLDLPIRNSDHETEKKNVVKAEPIEETKISSASETVKSEVSVPPINIKMEEPLMINEPLEADFHEELPESAETPVELHEPKLASPTKSYLNDIGEIFTDSGPIKLNSPDQVKSVNIKPTPPPKKTLVRCLDSNGKIIFAELQVDPNNPKNIKIVKTPTVIRSAHHPGGVSVSKPKNIIQLKLGTAVEQKRIAITSNVLNSPNRVAKVNPMASTMVNPKPMIVNNNPNLTRLNPVGAKTSMENKKIFFIKSSTSANLNSANPPPLVRITDPTKVVLAPNLRASQANETIRKMTLNPNNVIMKNGKIMILDRDKANVKPKQESLLKPQVSLLKPLVQKQLSDTASAKSILVQRPSAQLLGNRCKKRPPTNPIMKRDYQKEFGTMFLRHRFQSVRSAIEYVLKNTPLVNGLASRPEFNAAFPFVVESHEKFSSFPFAKRRSNEWYRAKFALRMIQQHPDLKDHSFWITREIIIFGRRFGYTPANAVTLSKHILNNENPFKDMIKQHIKEEQLKNVTITFNDRVKDFLQKYDDLKKTYSITATDPLEIVDVDGSGSEPLGMDLNSRQNEISGDKLVLDVNKIVHDAGLLVNDMCHNIRIKLEKEEIVDGVLCSSSQLVLWQAMRSFMEDLVRRSFATKPLAEQISDLSAERCVRVDDIRRAISTTENFSFLTNKHLGKHSS